MSKTVINKRDQFKWDNGFDPNGQTIPEASSSDVGKVLGVDSNGKYVLKEDAGSVLPEITPSDEGKVLKVESGTTVWGTDEGIEYTAGDNVQISSENVISATNTTYTAGTNVSISAQNEISATDTTYSAGTGISIDGSNVISADSQLPSVSSTDEGKVLKVDANGDWSVGTDNDTTYTAGTNVQINGDVISATDTTYTAGTNVSISAQNVISATDTTYTAGANVQINDNVISATDTVYTLPTADASTLGGIKVGTNLSIDSNGVLSATDTTYSAGTGITISGTSISADSQLPSYSSTENGKVLSVDSNGDLEWSTPSEDIVTFNFDETTSGSGVYELKNGKTSDDIVSAIASGKAVYLIQGSIATVAQVYALRSYIPNTTIVFTWEGNNTSAGTVTVNQASMMLILGTTTSVTLESQTVGKELPTVSSSDEGKVLKVDSNGDWVAGNASPAYCSATGTLYTFSWDADSADSQTYTATEDCIVEYALYGVGGESGSFSTLGLRYFVEIYKTSGTNLLRRSGRFTTMAGTIPTVEDFIFLKKGYTIKITHIIRHSTSDSHFTARPLE